MQYFHFIWSGKYYFVIITLQHCVSPCLALTAEGNRDHFIMSINWVNWLILISCFLNLTRDSASLGKHTILQQDQKQRKPDNKSFWFQGMFTRQTFNILAEVKQITDFAKHGLLRAVLMLETSQKGPYTKEKKKENNQPLWISGTCNESVDLGGSTYPTKRKIKKKFCKETFWKIFTVTVFKIQTNNHNDILGLDDIARNECSW